MLLSVELCSLTLQRDDASMANLVASGLFGDGAAAVVVAGARRDRPAGAAGGPRARHAQPALPGHRAGRWAGTSAAPGSASCSTPSVPEVVERYLGERRRRGSSPTTASTRDDIGSWVCHPGGPKVLEALQAALGAAREALALTWESLAAVGNLSSASVLHVLRTRCATRPPAPGSHGVLLAMGPGLLLRARAPACAGDGTGRDQPRRVHRRWSLARRRRAARRAASSPSATPRGPARAAASRPGRGHYPVMVVLHTGLLVGALVEVWLRRPAVPAVARLADARCVVAAAGAALVVHRARSGRRWNTRVIVVPGPAAGHRRARTGWLRHPNYVAVVVEGVALPLVHTAWVTALVFTVLNAVLLTVRIRARERGARDPRRRRHVTACRCATCWSPAAGRSGWPPRSTPPAPG